MQYLWGLWPDHQTHYEVLTGIAPDQDRLITAEMNAQVLMRNWIADDNQFIFSKRRLDSLDDFDNLRTFSPSIELSDWLRGMGADSRILAYPEVYTALERDIIIDAAVTGANRGLSERWYEVTDYMNGPLHSFNATINAINNGVWRTIPSDLQQILIEEGAKQELEALRLAAIQNLTAIQRNVDIGLELVEFDAEMRMQSFQAARLHVLPNWVERLLRYSKGGWQMVEVFNSKIGPLVGLNIRGDGSVANVPITEGPHAGKTIEEILGR